MKKFIWLLILLSIFTIKANAETYYSEYKSELLSEEYIESNDTTKVEPVRYYNWYKVVDKPLDYAIYESDKNFIVDDCYYTKPTAFSNIKPIDHESRIVETKTTYTYTIPNKVRYIHLSKLQGSYRSIRITELLVLINNQEVDYAYTCDGCWGEFDTHIHNGIWNENESYIANGGSIIIDLGKEYSVEQVELVFYLFDMANITKTYTIAFSTDKENTYAQRDYQLDFIITSASQAIRANYNVYNMNLEEYEWASKKITNYKMETGYINEDISITYSYKEKWCRKYEKELVYSNIYSDSEISGYSNYDENDYVDYYKYSKRDKITVQDHIIINDKNKTIDDYISSTSDYEVSNFDINKNGTYNITIKTDYKTINKNIKVDILENDLQEKEEQINALKKELEKLNTLFEETKLNYQKANDELNNKISALEGSNQNYQNELDKALKEKEQLINDYSNQLLDLSNKVNDIKLKYQSIIDENMELTNLNDKITIEYNNKINLLNKEIKSIKEENNYLNDLNDAYYNQIQEFQTKNEVTNNNIKEVIKHEEQLVQYYENKLLKLQEENKQKDKENKLKDEKNSQLTNELDLLNKESKEKQENLNSKLNNYVLKIDKLSKNIWLFILLLLFLVYLLQKKSSKKKN